MFTLSRSWHDASWLYEQLGFASAGDTVLLMQDGVLALQSNISLASFLAKCVSSEVRVAALANDCQLRGIENQYPAIELIDYPGFVDLVCSHDKQVAW
ncbi:MAG: sulfurtransferase complex subunit TusB [Pseudomonadota bacterium]